MQKSHEMDGPDSGPDAVSPVVEERIRKGERLKAMGVNLYPAGYRVDITVSEVVRRFGDLDAESLEKEDQSFSMAGRIISKRDFGKASFIHIKDGTGRIQAYIRKDKVSEKKFSIFKLMDIGDFIGVSGTFFRTRTGELTLLAQDLELLSKSLRPLPEKWHGLTDVEIRYRQRYIDLIVNDEVKEVFVRRSRIIQAVRDFFIRRGFLEVETPMMQPIPGGATARPFKTFHNALGMNLYLRVAPELYLKRLVVGGLEKVFEINRNFRNEGISVRHNPEFTMLEFYMSHATYEDLMGLTEELFCSVLDRVLGKRVIEYQGETIDFSPPWRRIGLFESLLEMGGVENEVLENEAAARACDASCRDWRVSRTRRRPSGSRITPAQAVSSRDRSRRSASATAARMPPSACCSRWAMARARSCVWSTMTRRSTTKNRRRGRRRGWPGRCVSAARAKTWMSSTEVLPVPVPSASTSG